MFLVFLFLFFALAGGIAMYILIKLYYCLCNGTDRNEITEEIDVCEKWDKNPKEEKKNKI